MQDDAERIAAALRASRPSLDPLLAIELTVWQEIVGALCALLDDEGGFDRHAFSEACGVDVPPFDDSLRNSFDGAFRHRLTDGDVVSATNTGCGWSISHRAARPSGLEITHGSDSAFGW